MEETGVVANGMSRRLVLQKTALFGSVAVLGGVPLMGCSGSTDVALDPADWPGLAEMARERLTLGSVSNCFSYLGKGDAEPIVIGDGLDRFGGERKSDADSLYRIYSMTKPVTGIAAMILIGEGALTLDTELAEVLPNFAEMQVMIDPEGPLSPDNLEPAIRPITIRQLLTHTSGLAYSAGAPTPLGQATSEAGLVPGMPLANEPDAVRASSLEAYADGIAALPLPHQPGTQWVYSCSLDVLGRVIEVVSGQSFDAFLKERIFDPCGMDSTFFKVPESEIARFTDLNGVSDGEKLVVDPAIESGYLVNPPFPMGGSGLVSSARDYDRFLKMIGNLGEIDGNRVMAEETMRIATSNILPDTVVTEGSSVDGYGYGAGGRIGWSGMANAFGWVGAAGTVGYVDMESGLRAGFYTQYREIPPSGPGHFDFENAVEADLAFQKGLAE